MRKESVMEIRMEIELTEEQFQAIMGHSGNRDKHSSAKKTNKAKTDDEKNAVSAMHERFFKTGSKRDFRG